MKKLDLSNFGMVSGTIFVLFFVSLIIPLVLALKESNDLREFKVDLFVLCNESTMCTSESEEGRVRISTENLYSLYALMASANGDFTIGHPAQLSEVAMEFDCHDEIWDLSVEKLSDNKLRVTLDGPRKYVVYIKNQDKYNVVRKIASLEGFRADNKLMKKNN